MDTIFAIFTVNFVLTKRRFRGDMVGLNSVILMGPVLRWSFLVVCLASSAGGDIRPLGFSPQGRRWRGRAVRSVVTACCEDMVSLATEVLIVA